MSVTQTTTTTTITQQRAEVLSDLQLRLQPPSSPSSGGVQQVRFRTAATTIPGALPPSARKSAAADAPLARRFSFVWPFILKESAGTEPFLKSRCSQLLRQFPAFLSGRQDHSALTVRDLISRVLTQLKAVWLVLAVYLSLLVLTVLSSAVLYTFLLATKPPGLWFLAACIAATGAIAAVSFTARERPGRRHCRSPAASVEAVEANGKAAQASEVLPPQRELPRIAVVAAD